MLCFILDYLDYLAIDKCSKTEEFYPVIIHNNLTNTLIHINQNEKKKLSTKEGQI